LEDENSVELSHPLADFPAFIAGTQFMKIVVNNTTLKIGRQNSCFMTVQVNVVVLKDVTRLKLGASRG